MESKRNLTEADVEAIVDALEERLTKKFYSDVGKGVWDMVWKTVIVGVVAVAAYGASRGIK